MSRALKELLKKYNVKITKGLLYAVEIAEDDPHFNKVTRILNKVDTSTVTAIYSKDEYETATWYKIGSTWNPGYPQTSNEFPENTYDVSNRCPDCFIGRTQNNLFRIKKEYNWKKKHFFMLHWVWDEIFTNVETAELLKNNGIKGFEIQDVLIGNEISPITKQIKIINKLELGYIPDEKYGEIKECKTCGNKQYYTLGRQSKYSKNIFEGINVDIIKRLKLWE